jgi:peroxin-2
MSSSPSSSWEHAWTDAQPRLREIRDSILSFPGANPRAIRVGQLDAELLDQELVTLLKDPLIKAFSLIKV